VRSLPFNSLYWDFCSVSLKTLTCRLKKHRNFQFPLLGFLFCIVRIKTFYSFTHGSFNSLYWDFCSVSPYSIINRPSRVQIFQFPLLGFLFCILPEARQCFWWSYCLSIPFIGIFVLYHFNSDVYNRCPLCLSIPFIGIFVLYLKLSACFTQFWATTFNSLYWDFCSVS